MKKKIIEKISVMLITMLLIPNVFGNVVAEDPDWENMTMDEIIANYDPNCQNMTEDEFAMYIEEERIQSSPEVMFDDPENFTQEPLIFGSHSLTFEPPWSVHYIDNLTEEFGLGTQGGWQGDTDGYQGWTDVITSANLVGEISITVWLVQGFYFLAPVTDTYTFTFDYNIKGNHWGQIHGIINPFTTAVASSETAVDFEVGSITERENIAYDQTIPIIHEQYNNNFNEHLIHTIECQLSEGSYYLVRAVGGTKARSLGVADAAAETHNKLDDYSESGWGDGVIINSIVIDWPNHPPEGDLIALDVWISSQADDFNKEHIITEFADIEKGWSYLHFEYEWTGLEDSPEHFIVFLSPGYYGDPYPWGKYIEPPESTRIISREFWWEHNDPDPGEYIVYCWVDFWDYVDEPDEGNNMEEYNFEIYEGEISDLTPESYDFGTVKIGESKVMTFSLIANYHQRIQIWMTGNCPVFEYEAGIYTLIPNEEKTIEVTFRPDSEYHYEATLHVDIMGSFNDLESYLFGDGKKSHSTCFLAGTQIAMADGTYKNIEEIEIGDMVLSCDRFNSRTTDAMVTKVYHHTPDEMGDYYLIINDNLGVTPNHPLYINGMWKYADDAVVGDYLLGNDGEFIQIELIERIYEQVPTYNFDITAEGAFGIHTYITDGTLVSTKIDLEILASFEITMQGHPSYQELLGGFLI